MKRLARRLLILSASLWLLSVMSPLVTPAWADINGNCGATFKGVDIKGRGTSSAGDAIDVDNNEVVNVNMTSPAGFTSHKVELEIAGVSRTVSNQPDAGDTQWSDTVNVKDYAWMGVGLYTVTGSATLSDGSTCSGSALINVSGFPLTTVAGGAAAAATIVGLAAVAVLLQQFAVAPLTREMLIECLIGGLIIGIALPSLGKLWSVLRVNAAVRRAEQRLRAAMPKAGPPPESKAEPPQA